MGTISCLYELLLVLNVYICFGIQVKTLFNGFFIMQTVGISATGADAPTSLSFPLTAWIKNRQYATLTIPLGRGYFAKTRIVYLGYSPGHPSAGGRYERSG
jgi:hypothetical protein